MTVTAPEGVSYCRVRGKWIEFVADGPDGDPNPDARPLVGAITATPSVSGTGIVKIGNTGAIVRPITMPIVNGEVDFWVVASADQDTNPPDWTYRIDVRFTGGGSYFFHIEAPADGDVDLILASAVAGSGGSWVTEGPPGPSNVLTVGTVTGLPAGATPTATITGTSPSQTISFGIPAGAKGDKGDKGDTGAPGPAVSERTTSGTGWRLNRTGASVTVTLTAATVPITIPAGYRPTGTVPGLLSAPSGVWLGQASGSSVTVLGPAVAGTQYAGALSWTTTEAMPA